MTTKLLYLFDPLCGWCYASAPALATLARHFPQHLELWPSGLFSGAGSRDLTPDFAAHAWHNDQRIASMTGRVFSERYRADILHGDGVRFDSGVIARALTWVRALDAALEPQLLHRAQLARYVDGKDTALPGVVAEIAASLASEAGHAADAAQLAEALSGDAVLARDTDARIAAAQALMRQAGIRGVPQLLVRQGDALQAVGSNALYQNDEALAPALRQLLQSPQPPQPR